MVQETTKEGFVVNAIATYQVKHGIVNNDMV
jgi:hypothetical protein